MSYQLNEYSGSNQNRHNTLAKCPKIVMETKGLCESSLLLQEEVDVRVFLDDNVINIIELQ